MKREIHKQVNGQIQDKIWSLINRYITIKERIGNNLHVQLSNTLWSPIHSQIRMNIANNRIHVQLEKLTKS
jgi:hypothetical protein